MSSKKFLDYFYLGVKLNIGGIFLRDFFIGGYFHLFFYYSYFNLLALFLLENILIFY